MFKKALALLLCILTAAFCAAPSFAEDSVNEPTAITAKSISLSKKSYVYDGKAKTPNVTVNIDGSPLRQNSDYTVKYSSNKAVGTATVSVMGKGGYCATVKKSFSIVPPKPTSVKASSSKVMQLTVSWKKAKSTDGYEIQYAKKSSFKGAKTLTVKNKAKLSTRGIKGGKYYIRVRGYKTVKGKKYYSAYTKAKRVTVVSPTYKTSSKNIICLTFDDGPSANVTPRVLDTLKKNNVKATFFIVNYSKENKKLVKRIINEGHTLGVHCYSHDYAKIYKSKSAFVKYYNKLAKKIKKDFNYDVKVMRFPGGSSNMVSRSYSRGVMTKLAKYMHKQGIEYYDWNVSSEDATAVTASASQIYHATVSGLCKKRTNVVLMHDASAKTTTADSLQKIIDYGYNNGYVFSAITEDTTPVHHAIAN